MQYFDAFYILFTIKFFKLSDKRISYRIDFLKNEARTRADFHIFLWGGGYKKFRGGGDDHVQGWIQDF